MSQEINTLSPARVRASALAFLDETYAIKRIYGGVNNKVYLAYNKYNKIIIKLCEEVNANLLDKYISERDFLLYANEVSGDYTPKLVFADDINRCLLIEYIDGQEYKDGDDTLENVLDAAVFLRQLNDDIEKAKLFLKNDAKDGFFSVSQHILDVSNRIYSLSTEHLMPYEKKIAQTLLNRLSKKFDALKNSLEAIEYEDSNPIRCISPSDFGLHNAINRNGRPVFIDFEFAGWDDPAKTVIDFFLQPKINISNRYASTMMNSYVNQIDKKYLAHRINILAPVLHLKWCTIILNVLNPNKYFQIYDVVEKKTGEDIIFNRLNLASSYIEREINFGLH